MNTSTHVGCQFKLIRGQREGKPCGRSICRKLGVPYCQQHAKKIPLHENLFTTTTIPDNVFTEAANCCIPQPTEMQTDILESGVCTLPTIEEPKPANMEWGVTDDEVLEVLKELKNQYKRYIKEEQRA